MPSGKSGAINGKPLLSGVCQDEAPFNLFVSTMPVALTIHLWLTIESRPDKRQARKNNTLSRTINNAKVQDLGVIFFSSRKVKTSNRCHKHNRRMRCVAKAECSALEDSNKGSIKCIAAMIEEFSQRRRRPRPPGLFSIYVVKRRIQPQTSSEAKVYPAGRTCSEVGDVYQYKQYVEDYEQQSYQCYQIRSKDVRLYICKCRWLTALENLRYPHWKQGDCPVPVMSKNVLCDIGLVHSSVFVVLEVLELSLTRKVNVQRISQTLDPHCSRAVASRKKKIWQV